MIYQGLDPDPDPDQDPDPDLDQDPDQDQDLDQDPDPDQDHFCFCPLVILPRHKTRHKTSEYKDHSEGLERLSSLLY